MSKWQECGHQTSETPKNRPCQANRGRSWAKGQLRPKNATRGKRGPNAVGRAFLPGGPGEKRTGSIFPWDRFTGRNPFTATFSVFCGRVCAYLPKFACPAQEAGRRGEKEKARRFCVSLLFSKVYEKTPGLNL